MNLAMTVRQNGPFSLLTLQVMSEAILEAFKHQRRIRYAQDVICEPRRQVRDVIQICTRSHCYIYLYRDLVAAPSNAMRY